MASRTKSKNNVVYTQVPNNETVEDIAAVPIPVPFIKDLYYYGIGAALLFTHFSILYILLNVIWLSYESSECPHL